MTTLKGVFPDPKPARRKNFIQENVRNLRRMEQFFSSQREMDELQKLDLQNPKGCRYHNVGAKVQTSLRELRIYDKTVKDGSNKFAADSRDKNKQQQLPYITSKSTNNLINKKSKPQVDLKRGKTEKLLKSREIDRRINEQTEELTSVQEIVAPELQYKSRGIQTLEDSDFENMYEEGVVRYASVSKKLDKEGDRQADNNAKERITSSSPMPTDRGDMTSPPKLNLHGCEDKDEEQPVDFVKLNKQRTSIAAKMAAQLNNGVLPSSYKKGVVPKYLRERKEAKQQEDEKAKAEAPDPDCPGGHIALPDDERIETLTMLNKNYQEFITELNKLPIRTDTLRSQKRKMEIERQLKKLEEGIKVFSRPKVFIKINA